MTSLLYEEARKLLAANDFAGAREAYRHAALHETPGRLNVGHLNWAEANESLAFRHTLREKYPHCLHIWLVEIEYSHKVGLNSEAVELCTEALGIFQDVPDQMEIRLSRLEKACVAIFQGYDAQRYIPLILEDVRSVWQETHDDYEFIEGRKAKLLKRLFPVLGNKHIPILETLAQDEMFPPVVRQAFEAKIAQLRALDEALKAL